MAEPDLTEAVEAAAREHVRLSGPVTWDDLTPSQRHRMMESIAPLMHAAAPSILAQCPRAHDTHTAECRETNERAERLGMILNMCTCKKPT